jgi:hypothetical protein
MQPTIRQSLNIVSGTLACVGVFVACANGQSPPNVGDVNFGFALRGYVVNYVWPLVDGSPPISWDNFHLSAFRPENGVSTGPKYDATFDPDTQLFHWDSFESPFGRYQWTVRATNEFGSDTGTFEVYILSPEPSSTIIAVIGMLGFARLRCRRRHIRDDPSANWP